MELLLFVSLCLLTFTGKTFSDGNDIVKISYKEDEDVILPCSFKETLEDKRFDWKKDDKDVFLCNYGKVSPSSQHEEFRGRVFHFPDQLNSGNASIRIEKAKVSDSGTYTCLNIDSTKSYKIELVVDCILKDRRGEIPAVCPKPTITIAGKKDAGMLVKCSVLGFPVVELLNSADESVPAGTPQPPDHFFTVTKEDQYRCVATQKEYCHQMFSERTLVTIPGETDVKGVAFGVCGLVVGVFGIIAAAVFYVKHSRNKNSSDKTDGRTKDIQGAENNPLTSPP